MTPPQILVVEDENITAQNICQKLRNVGYNVSAVTAYGEEAIAKAEALRPDLVLMDIGLAGEMDGIEAAAQIYQQFNIPVIYLTAYTDESKLQRAKLTEPFGYLLKPFQARELRGAIEMALHKHKLELELRESRAELAAIFDSTPTLMILVDQERRVRKINRAAMETANRPAEEMLGRRGGEALRCIHALDVPAGCGFGPACQTCTVRRVVLDTFEKGHGFHQVEAQLTLARNEKSETRNLLLSTTPLTLTGSPLALVCIDDITARQQAEEKLREAETNYRTVANFAYDWETWENPDGAFRYVSPSCERITGYTAQEFINQPQLFADLILPEDRPLWTEHRRNVTLMPRCHDAQFRIQRRNGEIRWLEHVCQPVSDDQGAFLGYRASNRDITLRKQATEGLQDSVQKLKIAYEQATIYAQELTGEITERKRIEKELQKLNAELEQRVTGRTRELAALYDVTAVASEALSLDAMLSTMLQRVLVAMQSSMGYIHLLAENGETLTLMRQQGLPPSEIPRLSSVPVQDVLLGRVVTQGQPLVSPRINTDPRFTVWLPFANLTYVGMPMSARGRIVGVISMLRSAAQQYTTEELALLGSVADQVGVAIENAQLRQQAEQAAITQERVRLSRELHDSVVQLLYSIKLFAKSGKNAYHLGDEAEVQHCLTELGDSAQQALKEMRLLVYELRASALETDGLTVALQHRLDAVEQRVGVMARLQVNQAAKLPPQVEKEFYHIAIEALNNTLKHAQATTVTINIECNTQEIKLEIMDNGLGFALNGLEHQGGMGLLSMRERAERLGGQLTIETQPGAGVQIKVEVPVSLVEVSDE
jgi:PAS domain S-box-containing protein